MTRAFFAICLAALVGCATAHRAMSNSNPNKTRQDYYRDKTKCRAAAGQAYPNAMNGSVVDAAIWRQAYDECMYGEGWYYTD